MNKKMPNCNPGGLWGKRWDIKKKFLLIAHEKYLFAFIYHCGYYIGAMKMQAKMARSACGPKSSAPIR
jgi:hypothetical protein